MSHICEAALITCEDFRLHQRKDGRNYISEFIKDLGVDCDLITRAGGIQDIVRPKEKGYCDCLLRDSSVSAKLHHVHVLYLVHHADCGAYKELKLAPGEEEFKQHKSDMLKAKKEILKKFAGLQIILYYADLVAGTEDEFFIKKIG